MKPGSAVIDVCHRPGRLHRNQPAHHPRRADLRLQRRDPLLRAQFHRRPGPLQQRGHRAGHAALPADIARAGVDAAMRNVRSWRAASIRAAAREAPSEATTTDPRIMPADVALAEVQSGQRVYIHNGCAEPVELVQALTRRGPNCATWKCSTWPPWGSPTTACRGTKATSAQTRCSSAAMCAKPFRKAAPTTRPSSSARSKACSPPALCPIDVCLLQCTPPDHYGYMSLGPSIDVSLTAAQCARHVIVEINDQCRAPWATPSCT